MMHLDNLAIQREEILHAEIRFHINVNVTTTNRDPCISSVTLLWRDTFAREDAPLSVIGYSTLDCSASTLLCELMFGGEGEIRTIQDGLVDRAAQIAALLNVIPDANLSAVMTQLAATFVGPNPLTFTREIAADRFEGMPSYIEGSIFRLFAKMVAYGPNERVVRALRRGGSVHKHVSSNMLRYMSCLEN